MATKKPAPPFLAADALATAFATNKPHQRVPDRQQSTTSDAALRHSLNGDGRINGFKPDAASFFAHLVAHDAHHGGQITMLARQSGHPVSQSAMFGLWEWGTR